MAPRIAEPHFETRLYQELDRPTRTDLSSCFLERTADEWESWARERDLPIVAVREADDGRTHFAELEIPSDAPRVLKVPETTGTLITSSSAATSIST